MTCFLMACIFLHFSQSNSWWTVLRLLTIMDVKGILVLWSKSSEDLIIILLLQHGKYLTVTYLL